MRSQSFQRRVCHVLCATAVCVVVSGAAFTSGQTRGTPSPEQADAIRQAADALETLSQTTENQREMLEQLRQTADRTRELERVLNLVARQGGTPTDPLSGPVVVDAPFSADATTTVTQTLGDGTRIEQTTSSRFYRDKSGRVRREQTILGLGGLGQGDRMQTITVDPDPGDGFAYTLDPSTRTARRVPTVSGAVGVRFRTADGTVFSTARTEPAASVPANSRTGAEALGTRQFEGVKATGRKSTTTIPIGEIGNDRPIEITDERWESPELRMLVYSRSSDPRTGVVEFRLTNISRTEPPADLFVVPGDYSVAEGGGRGGAPRSGGPGGQGGRGTPTR